ncbi:exonuclease SbcCD subunit D C-terminal domain-containing protein [Saprospira sp. CCB-QB6]|uniref:exonuclease SbcCD subunit D C-terminal domain-containing protein n=1 Tax=Saprospira sp. CCB-QB6 TaxID=3023936 RepID=UPI0023499F0F|nr:exonuclease SbcCD subunit D C-terminal domain-containing protein [Saprospira sp. CCB-QB6]WCL80781.1 exonuclease SbcCD subunit D C-terminal domain-containing protein [Saprospira sp. CCB-QB6]
MKVLHTADWHLGHKLFNQSREEEHAAVLQQILDFIIREKVELLIIAGDVFDQHLPPNYAQAQYYNFLKDLQQTPCHTAVVVAGNHDSFNFLDSSKQLLNSLNVKVVANLPTNLEEQLIEIRTPQGELQAYVAAVPFLRERELRQGQMLPYEERILALKQAIRQHYADLAALLADKTELNIPLIATGHLYVDQGQRDGRSDYIHIGQADLFPAQDFPSLFDYVALGHLHRPQKLGEQGRICYSGSILPMDFNEINYAQSVQLLEFEGRKLLQNKTKPLQLLRRLIFYKGDEQKIRAKLEKLPALGEKVSDLLKLELEVPQFLPALEQEFRKILKGKAAELISMQQKLEANAAENQSKGPDKDLAELSPEALFDLYLQEKGTAPKAIEGLQKSFTELLSWMQEQDRD